MSFAKVGDNSHRPETRQEFLVFYRRKRSTQDKFFSVTVNQNIKWHRKLKNHDSQRLLQTRYPKNKINMLKEGTISSVEMLVTFSLSSHVFVLTCVSIPWLLSRILMLWFQISTRATQLWQGISVDLPWGSHNERKSYAYEVLLSDAEDYNTREKEVPDLWRVNN